MVSSFFDLIDRLDAIIHHYHILQNSTEPNVATNKESEKYVNLSSHNTFEEIFLYMFAFSLGLSVLLPQYFLGPIGISLFPYICKRYRGYHVTKQLHSLELDCDASSVRIRKTPEEKIATAKGFRAHINPSSTTIIVDFLRSIFFSRTHPSLYCRLQQMNRMIAEQQAIIDTRTYPTD